MSLDKDQLEPQSIYALPSLTQDNRRFHLPTEPIRQMNGQFLCVSIHSREALAHGNMSITDICLKSLR